MLVVADVDLLAKSIRRLDENLLVGDSVSETYVRSRLSFWCAAIFTNYRTNTELPRENFGVGGHDGESNTPRGT